MVTAPDAVRRVDLESNGTKVRDCRGVPIGTREYDFTRPDGTRITIQEHSLGHQFGEGGVGDQGPHFNVRPFGDPRGKVPGTDEHYPFET